MSLCSSEEQEQMMYQGPRVAQLLLSNSPQAGPVEVPGVEHRSPEDLGFAVNAGSSALGFPLGAKETHAGGTTSEQCFPAPVSPGNESVHRKLALQDKCFVFTPPLRASPERS